LNIFALSNQVDFFRVTTQYTTLYAIRIGKSFKSASSFIRSSNLMAQLLTINTRLPLIYSYLFLKLLNTLDLPSILLKMIKSFLESLTPGITRKKGKPLLKM